MKNLTKKQKIIIIVVFSFLIFSIIGFLIYKKYSKIKAVPVNYNEVEVIVPDSNGDGLPDSQAAALGLNPKRTDFDNDGIFDVDEINITKTDPKKFDTDDDGVSDLIELRAGKNPNQVDK